MHGAYFSLRLFQNGMRTADFYHHLEVPYRLLSTHQQSDVWFVDNNSKVSRQQPAWNATTLIEGSDKSIQRDELQAVL